MKEGYPTNFIKGTLYIVSSQNKSYKKIFVGELCLHLEIEEWMQTGVNKELSIKPKMIAATLTTLFEMANQFFYVSTRWLFYIFFNSRKLHVSRKHAALHEIPSFPRNLISLNHNRHFNSVFFLVMNMDQCVNGVIEAFYVSFINMIKIYCYSLHLFILTRKNLYDVH